MPARRNLRHAQSHAVLQPELRGDEDAFNSSMYHWQATGGPAAPSSSSSPHAGAHPELTHIPRPRNAFIIYRQFFSQQYKSTTTVSQKNVSHAAGEGWWKLSPEERSVYNRLAEQEKVEHAAKYPEYKYCPKRTSTPKEGAAAKGATTPRARPAAGRSHSASQPTTGRAPSFRDYPTPAVQPPYPDYKEEPRMGLAAPPSSYQQVDAPFDYGPPPVASDFAGFLDDDYGILEPGFSGDYDFNPYSYEFLPLTPDLSQQQQQWEAPALQQYGSFYGH